MFGANKSPPRPAQWFTLALLLAWSWVVMTVTHEMGHVVGGLWSGATLTLLELRPWQFPHSLFVNDPHPLATLWSGPIAGCVAPLSIAILVKRPGAWFVAWFCVLANASYLLLAYVSGDGELDSMKILNAGTSPTILWAYILVSGTIGYAGFRGQCVNLMLHPDQAMTKQRWCISAGVLGVVIMLQTVVGSLLLST